MNWKKELKSWGITVAVILGLYVTGLHTEVIGLLQRVTLATGLREASVLHKPEQASYDMILEDLEGNHMALSELKGKNIFMNFWATWCPPCIAEMPEIEELYQELEKEDKAAFVMISVDEDLEKVKHFMERKGFSFPVYRLRSERPAMYRSNSIPTTFIISSEGKVVVRQIGIASYLNDGIRSLMKK
ncbi:TlpA disulfide reductase family protein [Algivirga pacifica]|uniref:Thioredoxin domain-containing protein n=1 Tax=Algivirga pacifica TaxID=1162670 RepID=A0ABP9DPK3_9BACT